MHRERFDAKLPLVLGTAYENIRDCYPRQISTYLVSQADLIFTMEESQVQEVLASFPNCRSKTSTVTAYVGETGAIEDYDNTSHDDFLMWLKDSRNRLDECIHQLVERLYKPNSAVY